MIQPAAAAAKSLQSCPTLCDPRDGSPPGSAIPGILQARTLEWVAISFSNAWKWKVKVNSLSHVLLLVTSWTAAHQAPPSMGFPGESTGVVAKIPKLSIFTLHVGWELDSSLVYIFLVEPYHEKQKATKCFQPFLWISLKSNPKVH